MNGGKSRLLIADFLDAERIEKNPLALALEQNFRDPDAIRSRFGSELGIELMQVPAETISSFDQVSIERLKDENIGAIVADELFMIAYALREELPVSEVKRRAFAEVQRLHEILKAGIDVHVATLNRHANSRIPFVYVELLRIGAKPEEVVARCSHANGDGEICHSEARFTAVYDRLSNQRVPLGELVEYMPQLDITEDHKGFVEGSLKEKEGPLFASHCSKHFWEGVDAPHFED